MSESQHNHIAQEADRFFQALLGIEKKLEEAVTEKQQGTKNILELMEKTLDSLQSSQGLSLSAAAKKLLQEQVNGWKSNIKKCERKIRESREAKEKLSKYPKELVIAVFGRTNSGKSTFGNFIKGKYLQNAHFANVYKAEGDIQAALTCSQIYVLEDAKKEKDAQDADKIDAASTVATPEQVHKLEDIKNLQDIQKTQCADWFKEGCTETTSAAQVFTMPGVVWMDTPGFGSTTEEFGNLAKKFAEYTDVLLYLDGSDSPGLRDHAHILKSFLEKGCPTWVFINRSDIGVKVKKPEGGYVKDENGAIVKVLQAKSAEARKAQEEQEITALKAAFEQDIQDGKSREQDFNAIINNVKVTSISGYLARLAVESQDAEEAKRNWQDSNMSQVYNIFEELACRPNLNRLKQAEGHRTQLTILNLMLHGDSEEGKPVGLKGILDSFSDKIQVLQDIDKNFIIDNESNRIVDSIMLALANDIKKEVDKATGEENTHTKSKEQRGFASLFGGSRHDSKQSSSSSVNISFLMRKAQKVMQQHVRERVADLLKDIFDKGSAPPSVGMAHVESVAMERQVEKREFTYYETDSYERDPDGFFEKVGSFFGKKYHSHYSAKRTKTQTIDHGFDPATVRKDVTDAIRHSAAQYVREELDNLKKHYLGTYIAVLQKGQEGISEAINELHTQREHIDKELKELEA